MAINREKTAWGTNDLTDPLTGAANKVEPTAEFKNTGLQRGEQLPRAYLNYILDQNHKDHVELQNQIDELVVQASQTILETIFHVGAIYITDSSEDPFDRFGFGLWERITSRFLVGASAGDHVFASVGKTGGSRSHSHSNNISIDPAGEHTHSVPRDGWGSYQTFNKYLPTPSINGRLVTGSARSENAEKFESLGHAEENLSTSSTGEHTHSTSGGIDSSSNLPPYRCTNIWIRRA